MRNLDECWKYHKEFGKATKANSTTASGRVIMVMKKAHDGKSLTRCYVAYDKESRVQLSQSWDKDKLIRFIQSKDLTMLGGNQQMSLF